MTLHSTTIKGQMDALCNEHGSSKLMLRIEELKLAHRYKVRKEYGRFMDQFGVFFDVVNEIVSGANYIPKQNWPKYRGLQYLLINHNIKFIYSSFEKLVEGFWEDSLVLSRPAYEAFIKVLYISLHPENSEAVMVKQKDKSKKFNLTNFIENELKVEWNDYKFYSIMTHSNTYKVLKEYTSIHKDGQKEPIVIKLKFEKFEFEMALNFLVFLCIVYLRMATQLLATSYNDSLPESLVIKANKLARLWQDSLRTHIKDYWPKVADDLDKVFKMINNAEEKQSEREVKIKKLFDKIDFLKDQIDQGADDNE